MINNCDFTLTEMYMIICDHKKEQDCLLNACLSECSLLSSTPVLLPPPPLPSSSIQYMIKHLLLTLRSPWSSGPSIGWTIIGCAVYCVHFGDLVCLTGLPQQLSETGWNTRNNTEFYSTIIEYRI